MFPLEPGIRLCSRFTLVRPLGRGGMGEVWLARDDQLDQEVVTKVVPADASTETIELLRQECRNSRRLSHPNIVSVFDFHQCDGVSFITMEHLEGTPVEDLRQGSIGEIVDVLAQLADALDHAHQAGVVHRDVKASNVLLDGQGRPRLMDFGIAGILHPGEGDLLLSGGGSRFSVSPQQLAGDPPHPADDVYGLGSLAYHLVTGSPPFWPDPDKQRIRIETPAAIDPARGVPPRLAVLIDSMLAKSRAERPAEMEAVKRSLEEIAAGLSLAETQAPEIRVAEEVRLTPPPRVEVARPELGRVPEDRSKPSPRAWMTLTLFAVLAALVLGVFVLLPGWVENRGQRQAAAEPEPSTVSEPSGSVPSQIGTGSASEEKLDTAGNRQTPSESPPTASERLTVAGSVPERTPPSPPRRAPAVSTAGPASQTAVQSDGDFRQAMSQGLAALEAGDSARAEQAFQRALTLSPGSPQAVDGLNRAEESLRLAAIEEHGARASELEGKEQWQAALEEYEAVLVLDPTIRFAQEGKERTEIRSELDRQLKAHIAHPGRLSEDEVLEGARQLLDQARSIEPAGPVLRRQMDSLTQQIAVATTPIRVELISDNLTEVTVYQVGRLGRFSQHTLDLRPGTYTVVGKRAGYRDVRRSLTVSPDQSPKPFLVRCEEEI